MSHVNEIGCWVSKEEGEQFHALAFSVGLDESALATLLVVRELHTKSLINQLNRYPPQKVLKEKRITARPKRHDLKAQFSSHAANVGLSVDAAIATLSRKEIVENWLGNAIRNYGNHLDSHVEA